MNIEKDFKEMKSNAIMFLLNILKDKGLSDSKILKMSSIYPRNVTLLNCPTRPTILMCQSPGRE